MAAITCSTTTGPTTRACRSLLRQATFPKLFDLLLVSQKTSLARARPDAGGVGAHYDQMFKDKTGAVAVSASLTSLRPSTRRRSIRSELAGTLTRHLPGRMTQKIAIDGGIAC